MATPNSSQTQTNQTHGKRGHTFCNKSTCRYCKLLNKSGTISCQITNEKFTTMMNISCRSSNVIYCISCKICGKQYVGQTLRRIRDRIYEHLRDIELSNHEKMVGKHFSSRDHTGEKDLEVHILEFIKKPPKSPQAGIIRDRREKRWIHLLRSIAPTGLNLED